MPRRHELEERASAFGNRVPFWTRIAPARWVVLASWVVLTNWVVLGASVLAQLGFGPDGRDARP